MFSSTVPWMHRSWLGMTIILECEHLQTVGFLLMTNVYLMMGVRQSKIKSCPPQLLVSSLAISRPDYDQNQNQNQNQKPIYCRKGFGPDERGGESVKKSVTGIGGVGHNPTFTP